MIHFELLEKENTANKICTGPTGLNFSFLYSLVQYQNYFYWPENRLSELRFHRQKGLSEIINI